MGGVTIHFCACMDMYIDIDRIPLFWFMQNKNNWIIIVPPSTLGIKKYIPLSYSYSSWPVYVS